MRHLRPSVFGLIKMSFRVPKKGNKTGGFREINKNALVISKRLKFPKNDRTDKNILVQPKMNLQSLKKLPIG